MCRRPPHLRWDLCIRAWWQVELQVSPLNNLKGERLGARKRGRWHELKSHMFGWKKNNKQTVLEELRDKHVEPNLCSANRSQTCPDVFLTGRTEARESGRDRDEAVVELDMQQKWKGIIRQSSKSFLKFSTLMEEWWLKPIVLRAVKAARHREMTCLENGNVCEAQTAVLLLIVPSVRTLHKTLWFLKVEPAQSFS